MTRRMTIIFAVSGLVKIFALYCYTIFWGAEGLREGCVKIMLIVSCLEWLMVEFKSDYTAPTCKMVLIFLVTKVFQEGTMFKWVHVSLSHEILCHAMVGDKVLFGSPSVCSSPLPSERITPWQPSYNRLSAILVLFEIRFLTNPCASQYVIGIKGYPSQPLTFK